MAGAFLITMTTMTFETYKDSRSRSYVPFLPFSFFFVLRLEQKDGVPAAARAPKCAGGRLGQIFVSASS